MEIQLNLILLLCFPESRGILKTKFSGTSGAKGPILFSVRISHAQRIRVLSYCHRVKKIISFLHFIRFLPKISHIGPETPQIMKNGGKIEEKNIPVDF